MKKISAAERARQKWTIAAKGGRLEEASFADVFGTWTAPPGVIPHVTVDSVETLEDGRVRACLRIDFRPVNVEELTRECERAVLGLLDQKVPAGTPEALYVAEIHSLEGLCPPIPRWV